LGNILEFGDRGEEEEEEEEEEEDGDDDADVVDDSVINPQGDDYFDPADAAAAPVSNSDTSLPRSFLRPNPQAGGGGGRSGENSSSTTIVC
jgi:hypothetical protein